MPAVELHQAAEAFFARTGAEFRHGGDRAFYAIGPDFIQLPQPDAFDGAEAYSATKAHELIHWMRHPSRLNREFGQKLRKATRRRYCAMDSSKV